MSLSLVIPAYNEEERLPSFLDSIEQYVRQNPSDIHEVIVVDDGSSDATSARAKKYKETLPGYRVITLEQNQGKGAAVREGVMNSRGDIVVFMDADGATSIYELPNMIEALKSSDIAVGNRWMKGAHAERHSTVRELSGFVYRMYMGLFGLGDVDTMCGFKGYKRDVARELFSDLIEKRWLFDTEIAYKARRRGYTVKNFPIRWVSKDGSKLDTITLLKTALQILPLIIGIRKKEL